MRNAFDAGSILYEGKWEGVGGALEIESFLGPGKWHRADRRVPFEAQKTRGYIWIRNAYLQIPPNLTTLILCSRVLLLTNGTAKGNAWCIFTLSRSPL
jgi:hypothetical protein